VDVRYEGRKQLGAGGRVCRWKDQRRLNIKGATSNASRHCQWRPDVLEAALSLPDGINPGRRTQNSSLHYKRLKPQALRVSRERWGAR